MYKHINSASRIHTLLTQAQSAQQPDRAMYAVLANLFDIKGTTEQQTAEFVLSRLDWLFTELNLLEVQVQTSQISAHLYQSAFERIRQVFSPLNLAAGWQGVRGNLTPDVLLALAFCNELLPDEETAISREELTEIAKEVAALSVMLNETTMPESLRKLIGHHIQLIQSALQQYQVFGAKALREAGRTALGEIIETKGTIDVPEASLEKVIHLQNIWKRINSAADAALKTEKIGQLGQRAWEALLTYLS